MLELSDINNTLSLACLTSILEIRRALNIASDAAIGADPPIRDGGHSTGGRGGVFFNFTCNFLDFLNLFLCEQVLDVQGRGGLRGLLLLLFSLTLKRFERRSLFGLRLLSLFLGLLGGLFFLLFGFNTTLFLGVSSRSRCHEFRFLRLLFGDSGIFELLLLGVEEGRGGS